MSARKMSAAAEKVGDFSEEDDANDKRWWNAMHRRTIGKIKRGFMIFLAVVVGLMILICAGAYLYLVALWLGTVLYGSKVHDAAALKSFIDSVLWSLLLIFATLFFENVFKDKGE